MAYNVEFGRMDNSKIVVVGCGGTGGFVAEGLCRILFDSDIPLLLVDHDLVEPHNLIRQNFYSGDVGKFKSQALAERLARQYRRRIGYITLPYDKDMFDEDIGNGMISKGHSLFIIGCVDNADARRSIASSLNWGKVWLDAGNGHHSGQVLIGNARTPIELKEGFNQADHIVSKLPAPSLQQPALLIPPTITPARALDCAEEVAVEEQSPTINQAMATLVVDFVHLYLNGRLTHMAAYIDLEAGSLVYVPAEPTVVARMCSMKVNELMANKCELGERYHV